MKFTIAQSILTTALKRASGVCSKGTTPMLDHVLITVTDAGVVFSSSDGEMAVSEYAPVSSADASGEALIPAKQAAEIARLLPGDTVDVEVVGNDKIEIRSGGAYFKLAGMSPDGFPGIPKVEGRHLEIGGDVLGRMIDGVAFSVSSDDSRYGLNGALLETIADEDGATIRLASTDGHRLSMVDGRAGVCDDADGPGVLISRSGLSAIRKICGDGSVKITIGEGGGLFESDGVVVFARFLEGEFPGYRQVIPKSHSRTVTVGRVALMQALRRVALVAAKSGCIRLSIGNGAVVVNAQTDAGVSSESVDASIRGGAVEIGVNGAYMADALGALDCADALIEMREPLHPMVVRDPDSTAAIYVVMPMRIE